MTPPPRDGTRQRVLEAARELFGRQGFDHTTVREIAQQVGLTDGALYYHFKSKREILMSVWEVPEGGGITSVKPDGPLSRERLDVLVAAAIDFSRNNDSLLRLMAREVLSGDKTAIALRGQNRSVIRKVMYDHIVTLHGPAEAEVRAEAVVAVIIGALMKRQLESGAAQPALTDTEFRTQLQRWVARLVFAPVEC